MQDLSYKSKISLNESTEQLGDSKNSALMRIFSLENKFLRNEGFKKKCVAFMRDYEDDGHTEKVQDSIEKKWDVYYMSFSNWRTVSAVNVCGRKDTSLSS